MPGSINQYCTCAQAPFGMFTKTTTLCVGSFSNPPKQNCVGGGEVMYPACRSAGLPAAGRYEAQVVSITDYYPGGSQISERSWSASSYRYGFNGMEKDDEVKGSGNSLDFGARIYDSRLVRWLSVDPHFYNYSSTSPYVFGGNCFIVFIDVDGNDIIPTITTEYTGKSGLEITSVHDLSATSASATLVWNEDAKQFDIQLSITIEISSDLAPDSDSDIKELNPGLDNEVSAHENGHASQNVESFNKETTYTYNGQTYTGRPDQILTQMKNDGATAAEISTAWNTLGNAALDLSTNLEMTPDEIEEGANKKSEEELGKDNVQYNNGKKKIYLNKWEKYWEEHEDDFIVPKDAIDDNVNG